MGTSKKEAEDRNTVLLTLLGHKRETGNFFQTHQPFILVKILTSLWRDLASRLLSEWTVDQGQILYNVVISHKVFASVNTYTFLFIS